MNLLYWGNDMETIKVVKSGNEQEWPIDKLVYLILIYCNGINQEKYDRLMQEESLLFNHHNYSWSKEELPFDLFCKYASKYPLTEDRAFSPRLLDYFSFPYQPEKGPGPIVYEAKMFPKLTEKILEIFKNQLEYLEFNYYAQRDLFSCIVNEPNYVELKKMKWYLKRRFQQRHKSIKDQLKSGQLIGREIIFCCKRDDFKASWQF
jgi:hypothetical protein